MSEKNEIKASNKLNKYEVFMYYCFLNSMLLKYRIPAYYYSVGEYADNSVCFEYDNGSWIIYDAERGKKRHVRTYVSFYKACMELIQSVTYDGEIIENMKEQLKDFTATPSILNVFKKYIPSSFNFPLLSIKTSYSADFSYSPKSYDLRTMSNYDRDLRPVIILYSALTSEDKKNVEYEIVNSDETTKTYYKIKKQLDQILRQERYEIISAEELYFYDLLKSYERLAQIVENKLVL